MWLLFHMAYHIGILGLPRLPQRQLFQFYFFNIPVLLITWPFRNQWYHQNICVYKFTMWHSLCRIWEDKTVWSFEKDAYFISTLIVHASNFTQNFARFFPKSIETQRRKRLETDNLMLSYFIPRFFNILETVLGYFMYRR